MAIFSKHSKQNNMSKTENEKKQEEGIRELTEFIRDTKLKHLFTDKDIKELLEAAIEGQVWLKEKL